MPKYKVTFIETYSVKNAYTVEADNEDEAEELASDLQGDSNLPTLTIDDFVEWEVEAIEPVE